LAGLAGEAGGEAFSENGTLNNLLNHYLFAAGNQQTARAGNSLNGVSRLSSDVLCSQFACSVTGRPQHLEQQFY
jgi:hypothetical protein